MHSKHKQQTFIVNIDEQYIVHSRLTKWTHIDYVHGRYKLINIPRHNIGRGHRNVDNCRETVSMYVKVFWEQNLRNIDGHFLDEIFETVKV